MKKRMKTKDQRKVNSAVNKFKAILREKIDTGELRINYDDFEKVEKGIGDITHGSKEGNVLRDLSNISITESGIVGHEEAKKINYNVMPELNDRDVIDIQEIAFEIESLFGGIEQTCKSLGCDNQLKVDEFSLIVQNLAKIGKEKLAKILETF